MRPAERGAGQSSPPYPFRHSGPCLVVGNAQCLPDDLARARVLFPDAPVIAVNGAAKEVHAFALFSYHPERFVEFGWIGKQRNLFGPGFTAHSVRSGLACPWVDYWWPEAGGSGGSAWGARKVAGFMGFNPVVLVGCPLDPGPYVGGHNLGGAMHVETVVADLRRGVEKDAEWHDGAYSMSGWTRDLLGEPKC